MKVYRVSDGGGSDLVVESAGGVLDALEGEALESRAVGDKITITVEEMTEEDYYSRPEWEGF